MSNIIFANDIKKVEVIEWTEINGKKVPKRTRHTYFNPNDKPDFGSKDLSCADKIFNDENLQTIPNSKSR